MCTCMHALTPSISIWMHPSKSGIWSNCQHLWHKLLDPSLQSMSSANTWMQGLRTKIDELQKVAFRLFEQKVFQPMGKENHTGKWFGYWHLLNKYWILCEFSWANLWVCQLSGPTFAKIWGPNLISRCTTPIPVTKGTGQPLKSLGRKASGQLM